MPNLHLNDIPDKIVNELRERAEYFHRPLEEEAKAILIQAITTDRWRSEMSADQLIERARLVREGHPQACLTEEFLRMAKENGRP
jgi:plasmid stability protein